MNVDVFLFAYRPREGCIPAFYSAMAHLGNAGHAVRLSCTGSALIHASRNQVLANVAPEADYVVMIDDDMLLDTDTITKLVESGLPVISGLCTTRGTPKDVDACDLALKVWDRKQAQFIRINDIKLDGLIVPKEGDHFGVGAACLAIRKDVIGKLFEHYLSAEDWMMDNEAMFNRLHVRSEYREEERMRVSAARYKIFEKDRYTRVFDFYMWHDTQQQTGEDIGFSMRLMQLGIPVAIDTSITPGHVGDYPYGIWNYVPKPNPVKAIVEAA